MVKFVEQELQSIRLEVTGMWTLVQQQLQNACAAVIDGDKELAKQVVAREKRVNAFELKIDSDVEDFIALYNPVAVDLRFALAMMGINNNLERIGDYAESIARFVVRTELSENHKLFIAQLGLAEMFDAVIKMLTDTLEALKHRDLALAKSVLDKDDHIDELNHNALDRLTDYASTHTEAVRFCLEVASVFRKLERAGDHINNLAEQTIYYIDAEVYKHRRLTLEDPMAPSNESQTDNAQD